MGYFSPNLKTNILPNLKLKASDGIVADTALLRSDKQAARWSMFCLLFNQSPEANSLTNKVVALQRQVE